MQGAGRLHIVDGTMNQEKYIKVLETRLILQANDWIAKDISGSIHGTSKMVLHCSPWPGNSPDNNPIENL